MRRDASPGQCRAVGRGEAPRLLLVAPNVSRRMGGEAIKALHILEGYAAMGLAVRQIAHARVRAEMSAYRDDLDIVYVEDGPVQIFLHKMGLDWLLAFVGSWLLHRAARREIRDWRPALVHFTSPISPTVCYFSLPDVPVVIGPLNGNLLHPPALLFRESRAKRLGALALRPMQLVNRLFFRGKRKARLFVSGGERTVRALEMEGCRREQMVMTLDSGVSPEFCEQPPIAHRGANWHFVFVGRLVRYKACDLVIRALALVPEARLDIIGHGSEQPALEALARAEGVADRVTCLGYSTDRKALFEQLRSYRAFVFPTLAEANGIVIQEAMMLGLPIVSVNWGGPRQLLDRTMAILIEPRSEAHIVEQVAQAMRDLAADPELAERLARGARDQAERLGFAWPLVLRDWAGLYDAFLESRGAGRVFGPWLDAAEARAPATGRPLGQTA